MWLEGVKHEKSHFRHLDILSPPAFPSALAEIPSEEKGKRKLILI